MMLKNEFDDDTEKINKDIIPIEMRSETSSEEEMMNTLKQQWWFQIFDPKDAQLDVSFSCDTIFSPCVLCYCLVRAIRKVCGIKSYSG